MNIFTLTQEAFRSLRANTSRTLLSILGIVIGIFSVVILMTLGEWAQLYITDQLSDLWANTIMVFGGWSQSDIRDTFKMVDTSKIFTQEILYGLQNTIDQIPLLENDANETRIIWAEKTISTTVTYQHKNISVTAYGVTPWYDKIFNYIVDQWSYITQDHNIKQQKVVVLWPSIATKLFGTDDPIGKSIQLNKWVYTVVGVTEGKSSQWFNGEDDRITMPLTSMEQMLGNSYVNMIYIKSASFEDIHNIKPYIESYLMSTLTAKWSQRETLFTIFDAWSQLASINSILAAIQAFLWVVAAISLLVWWVGVMNIMLVSVSERTQEIWIRKAIGALDGIILQQFLIESVALTLSWWLIAIILSYLVIIGFNLTWVIDITIAISVQTLVIAVWFATAVGVVFGLLPARKASGLKPIDALRFQ